MADKGTVGAFMGPSYAVQKPISPANFGTLSITGTAQLNEVPANALVRVFSMRGRALCATESAADGSFAVRNLAAGRYLLWVDGWQRYLPELYAVDVS